MIVYSPLQRRWLRHHFARWTVAYGWSAAEFAHRDKQPHDALAEALGLPVEDFAGPVEDFGRRPQAAAASLRTHSSTPDPVWDEPVALPEPGAETVIIQPGVELMPREKPPAAVAAPRAPYRPRAWVMLKPGHHILDGVDITVEAPADNPTATLVAYEVTPHVPHIVDGRNAAMQTTSMFSIQP